MNMDVATAIMSIRVSTDQCLMSGKMILHKFKSQGLCFLASKIVFVFIARIKTDDIVMGLDFIVSVVFSILVIEHSITFNTACITGLEDVVYVHVMFNNDLKRIVVRGCDENDKDALRWCVAKPDKRKSRKMSCKPFATLVYQKMGWDSECRYKMLGYRITFEGETLYVFDLLVPEIFHEGQRKKNAVDSQDNAASTKPVNSRKGFYLDDIVGTFGVPVEEHRKESEVKQMDGYVSMGILTGKIAPEAGKD